MTQTALDVQIEGNHYKLLKMQPLELAYRLNASPCFTKLAKYASRRKLDRAADLRKAIHCIELERDLGKITANLYSNLRVNDEYLHETMRQFCDASSPLYNALVAMYYRDYETAIVEVEFIMAMEGLDR